MTSRFDPKRKNGMSSQLSGLVPTPRTHRFRSDIFEAGECLQNCSLSHTTRDGANLGTCSAWVCESTKTEMYAFKSLFFSVTFFIYLQIGRGIGAQWLAALSLALFAGLMRQCFDS